MYRRHSRTNNAVEAYNCSLNKKIRSNGDFYAFAQILKLQEFEKYTTVRLLAESAGGVAETARQSRSVSLNKNSFIHSFKIHSFYHLLVCFTVSFISIASNSRSLSLSLSTNQVRDTAIKNATDDLDNKKITPRQFLTRVQFKCNLSTLTDFQNVATNSEDKIVDDLNLDRDTDEEEGGAMGGCDGEQQQQQPREQQICCICICNPVKILLLACGHYCICEKCFNVLRANAVRDGLVSPIPVPTKKNELSDQARVQYLVRCPKCRTMNSSITDVVNRKIFF